MSAPAPDWQDPPRSGAYKVIAADPPWRFATYSDRGKGRSAEAHYDCLDVEALKAMPVARWGAPDCALFLWTTDPMLPVALDIMRAWGFAYKTVGFYWVKTKRSVPAWTGGAGELFTGMGYWTRANPEMCLLGTRGRPIRQARDVARVVISPRREHSRKPDEVPARIERLLAGPYLELFARSSRPGWDSLGNQAVLFDNGSVPTRRRPSREPTP
ncbi:MT-A70 family methyltransferase [Marinivivus vitaminiproducens]|uniref:MT-A70 family methyltransferase n=1 Tax=Marinivivus vitaminiproducens TaxID=3035935 RepID=UPI0027A7D836|nr:MT-A70 family methyltransferase [Geminicoccaceae bacterium SCSIO 64248]